MMGNSGGGALPGMNNKLVMIVGMHLNILNSVGFGRDILKSSVTYEIAF